MEGSSDSVVLERLRAAFEKKETGAEGKGGGVGEVGMDAEASLGVGIREDPEFSARPAQHLDLFQAVTRMR